MLGTKPGAEPLFYASVPPEILAEGNSPQHYESMVELWSASLLTAHGLSTCQQLLK